jgi:hypothetical protein
LSRVRVPGTDGLDLDHAYKAMAWLGEVDAAGRSTAEAVEEALYRPSRCSVLCRSRFSTRRRCGSKALGARAWANTAIPKTTAGI